MRDRQALERRDVGTVERHAPGVEVRERRPTPAILSPVPAWLFGVFWFVMGWSFGLLLVLWAHPG